jgi:DICT domain-containing protein
VDANFSLFNLLQYVTGERITLQSVDHMFTLSQIIEQEIINLNIKAELYVGLQDAHHFTLVEERYQQIAQAGAKIHIFGVPSPRVNFPENIDLIALRETDKLSHEWFVLINHDSYAVALAGREFLVHDWNNSERRFFLVMTSQREKIRSFEAELQQAMMKANDPLMD